MLSFYTTVLWVSLYPEELMTLFTRTLKGNFKENSHVPWTGLFMKTQEKGTWPVLFLYSKGKFFIHHITTNWYNWSIKYRPKPIKLIFNFFSLKRTTWVAVQRCQCPIYIERFPKLLCLMKFEFGIHIFVSLNFSFFVFGFSLAITFEPSKLKILLNSTNLVPSNTSKQY